MAINKYCATLFILFALELNCFGFVDKYNTFILGIGFYDLIFLLRIFIVFITILLNPGIFQNRKICLNILPIGAVILLLTGTIAAYLSVGQPFIYGLASQREWISCILMYYPLRIWIQKGKLNFNKIVKTLLVASSIYIVICIIQYLLVDSVIFMSFSSLNERYGTARLSLDTLFPIIISAFCVDGVISNNTTKSKKVYFGLVLAGALFVVAVITKGRMATVSLAAGIIICLLIRRENIKIKIVCIALVGVALIVLFTSQIGQDVLDILFGSSTGISADTMTIREVEREYYLELLSDSFSRILIGWGYPSASWEPAVMVGTPTFGDWTYYPTDIGVIGHLFNYGILGIIWCFIIYIKFFINSFKIYKFTGRTSFLQIIIVNLISSVTLYLILFTNTIIFVLMYALLENMVERIKNAAIPNLGEVSAKTNLLRCKYINAIS